MFDNPIFWIVAIWWILSTLLGSKARRRRRALRAQLEAPQEASVEQATAPEEAPWEVEPGHAPTGAIAVEGEPLETEPEAPAPPAPPLLRREPSLEDFLRGLGLAKPTLAEQPPADLGPAEPAVVPVPEPEPPPRPTATPSPKHKAARPADRDAYAIQSVSTRAMGEFPLLGSEKLSRLTPLQQAVVLKEVLDAPRALRRRIR